jgi:hypothetical protein
MPGARSFSALVDAAIAWLDERWQGEVFLPDELLPQRSRLDAVAVVEQIDEFEEGGKLLRGWWLESFGQRENVFGPRLDVYHPTNLLSVDMGQHLVPLVKRPLVCPTLWLR